MRTAPDETENVTSPIDVIAHDLQKMRFDAGQISYSEIATRIENVRLANGVIPAAAHVARSTIYDVFRSGRKRVNAELVVEIVCALGADENEARMWRDRCYEASVSKSTTVPKRSETSSNYDPRLHRLLQVVILVSCIGMNIFGNTVAEKFALPLFLDMIGTAVAALIFGPWSGVLVALATGVTTTLSGSPQSLLFSLAAVAGALVWGYGYNHFGMGRTWWQFGALNLSVALVCTLVATPITVMIYGGTVSHASSVTTADFFGLGYSVWLAVFLGNFASSLADKFITGLLALLVKRRLRLVEISSQRKKVTA